MKTKGTRINGIYFPPADTCKAMIGRKVWCDNIARKDGYCLPHYKEKKAFDLSVKFGSEVE